MDSMPITRGRYRIYPRASLQNVADLDKHSLGQTSQIRGKNLGRFEKCLGRSWKVWGRSRKIGAKVRGSGWLTSLCIKTANNKKATKETTTSKSA